MLVAKQDQKPKREFTTKDTKDTKNGIRFKRTAAIGQVQKRKKMLVGKMKSMLQRSPPV